MALQCSICKGIISKRIKAGRWVTLKCKCQIVIIYFDGCEKTFTIEQYRDWLKEKQNERWIDKHGI